MSLFLISLAILIVGYIIYGKVTEKIFGIDPERKTPAVTMRDDVDYTPMPTWKVFLIQFLNIAGLGPIFGAIMGVMFGPAAFLWIALGTIFAGAVHDFFSAMISVRAGGVSLPEIIGHELGGGIKFTMRLFSIVLLILVGVVFVITPSGIIAGMTPEWMDKTFWVFAIFTYYILATLLPIDKLIGNFYPMYPLFFLLGILCNYTKFAVKESNSLINIIKETSCYSVVTADNERSLAASNFHHCLGDVLFPFQCVSFFKHRCFCWLPNLTHFGASIEHILASKQTLINIIEHLVAQPRRGEHLCHLSCPVLLTILVL